MSTKATTGPISQRIDGASRSFADGGRYCGVTAALVTPCRPTGTVDPAATGRLCQILGEKGCNGIFVASSTGEAVFLDEDDRRLLTVAARQGTNRQVVIYAGVSGLGLKQTIRYARNAPTDGADVAVVMSPFFLQISQAELGAYFRAVADASPIPIALYHHPRMPTPLAIETIAQVASHENIVAIKDTSATIDRMEALVGATAGMPFCILQGNERLVYESLKLGAGGMVTALSGFAPERHAALYRAMRSGDFASAQEHQSHLLKLVAMFDLAQVKQSISAFAFAIKVAIRRRGWLEEVDGMMQGFQPDPAFLRAIDEHLDSQEFSAHQEACDLVAIPTRLSS